MVALFKAAAPGPARTSSRELAASKFHLEAETEITASREPFILKGFQVDSRPNLSIINSNHSRLYRVDLKLVQGPLNALFGTFPLFFLGITLTSKALTQHISWKGGID